MLDDVFNKFEAKYRKFIAYIVLLLIVLLTVSLFKGIARVVVANKRITKAETIYKELEKERGKLEQDLSFVKSDEFVEKQLRDKLGLSKEGETILVLPDEETLKRLATATEHEEDRLPDPNWKKWLNLFNFLTN